MALADSDPDPSVFFTGTISYPKKRVPGGSLSGAGGGFPSLINVVVSIILPFVGSLTVDAGGAATLVGGGGGGAGVPGLDLLFLLTSFWPDPENASDGLRCLLPDEPGAKS